MAADQNPQKPASQPTSVNATANAQLKALAQHYVALVRAFMRDYPELNRLTSGVESSDRQIAMALSMALDDWNATPPLTTPITLTSVPSASLIVYGTVVQLLTSVGLLSTRNGVAYSDGNMTLNLDKTQQIMGWLNLFSSTYEQKKRQTKIAINLNSALGDSSLPSEYSTLYSFFDEGI